MNPNLLLLILRLLIIGGLYAFLAVIVWFLWQDFRQSAGAGVQAVPRVWLVQVEGEQRYPLRPVTSVGRGPGNTIVFGDDDTCSLAHALVTLRDGHWWVEDLGSRNGTAVNDEVLAGAVALMPGDIVAIGKQRLRLETDETA